MVTLICISMDNEDRRRYFVIGSVIVEIVQPILRTKLENEYKGSGFATLKAFLGSKLVLHTLYHLRQRGTCCTDAAKCTGNRGTLPLNYHQWNLMYAENPAPANHRCHCKYSARSVQLSEIDISLSSLILLNCFSLNRIDRRSIENLRTLKNNYLSHNTTGAVKESEYITIWSDLSLYILQLDNTKQDDLIRIERRPLDADLCHKYNAELLGMHQMMDDIGSSINGLGASITKVDANVTELKGILSGVSSLLTSDDRQRCIEMDLGTSSKDQTRQYRLGQGIFSLHREIDLFDKEEVTDMVTMDDGRIIMCIPFKSMIRIYDPERSQSNHINVDGKPQVLTTIDTQTVVFICGDTCKIKLYDIDSGNELKSFIIPEMVCPPFESITMVDKNLVVNGLNKLLIIDYHKEKIVRTIHTDCQPWRLHGVNGKIYCNSLSDYTCKKLYCYTLTDGNLFAITLPSQPFCTTSLRDGSLYVTCLDGSVLHVTSDLREFKPVENIALGQESMNSLSYDHNNSKLFITSNILSSRSSLLMYNSK